MRTKRAFEERDRMLAQGDSDLFPPSTSGSEPEDILRQIGWYREDTQFLSLNLNQEQADLMATAIVRSRLSRPEDIIAEALRLWLAQPGKH